MRLAFPGTNFLDQIEYVGVTTSLNWSLTVEGDWEEVGPIRRAWGCIILSSDGIETTQ